MQVAKKLSMLLFACGLVALVWLPVSGQHQRGIPERAFRQVQRPIPNQYIVVFNEDVPASDVPSLAGDLAAAHSGEVLHIYQHALKGFAIRLPETAARAISRNPRVEFVEEDGEAYPTTTQSNPPSWGLDRIDQRDLPLNGSYTYTKTGNGVTAYVIDSGIRTTHQDFGGRASVGADFIGDGQNGNDCNGHGTHVAGTIGGNTYGVAKGVRLVAVRVFGCGSSSPESTIIAGVDWVTGHNVKPAVANMSLGGSPSSSMDTAVRNSITSGVIYAVAAGNGDNNDGIAVDASTQSPARVTEALTVGATDISDNRASFSNFGSVVDTFAPGVGITSTWFTSDTATQVLSGTSMATPHVAGVAAQFLEQNPLESPATVAQVITSNATTGRVINPGTGSPNRLLYSAFNMGFTVRPTTDVDNPVGGPGVSCPNIIDSRLQGSAYFASGSIPIPQAYDSSVDTGNTISVYPVQQNYRMWSQRKVTGWSAIGSGLTSVKLRVKSACAPGLNGKAGCSVQYSLNNGSTWATLYSTTSTRQTTTDTAALPTTQNLTQLQVRVCGVSTNMTPTAIDPYTYSPVYFDLRDIRVDAF